MTPELTETLKPHLRYNPLPEGPGFHSLPDEAIAELARSEGWGLNQAMAACLEEEIWPERLRPNRGAFSAADQIKVLNSAAAVIGCGGLGGMVILQLARFGIGKLTVCDGDVFDQSNLNRQFLSRMDRLGKSKAACAGDEVAAINPAVQVRVVDYLADAENLPEILGSSDVALDCLDNLVTRYLLEETCADMGLPYIHGSVAGMEGFVMTVMPGDPGLRGLYGPEPAAKEDSAEVRMGVPTMTPAIISGLQVNQAVKLLVGRPAPGRRVLHLDLAAPSLDFFNLG